MIRLLLTRRWLSSLGLALVFLTACVFLGRWQWGRYVEAADAAAAVERNYQATPTPLDEALAPGSSFAPELAWTRVVVVGRYDQAGQLLVRNRPQDVVYGYEVVVPLLLPSGGAILVDRGWVRNAERADVLPSVEAAPKGMVTVTGWLRPGEVDLERDLPQGQLASINLQTASRLTGHSMRDAYLLLEGERTAEGAVPPRPQALKPPETGTGPHFAYALQWWLASPVGLIVVWVFARREWREGQGHQPPSPTGRPGPVAARPKKVRIWDEEDE